MRTCGFVSFPNTKATSNGQPPRPVVERDSQLGGPVFDAGPRPLSLDFGLQDDAHGSKSTGAPRRDVCSGMAQQLRQAAT